MPFLSGKVLKCVSNNKEEFGFTTLKIEKEKKTNTYSYFY